MIRHQTYFILASIASISNAIRVDWNTNTGPIIPPTSTVPPVPQQPYRQPAPVWENSENDIPNPHPYHYILPPPSRPRPATDNFARAKPSELQNLQYKAPTPNYGQFVTSNANSLPHSVPTLGVQYVSNKGLQYYALVPASGKVYYSKDVDGYDKYNKLNGKYNPKLKKHKAYEKEKHVKYNKYVSPKFQQQKSYYNNVQQQQNNYQNYQSTQANYDYTAQASRRHDVYYRPPNFWQGYTNSQR